MEAAAVTTRAAVDAVDASHAVFLEYFRCPDGCARFGTAPGLSGSDGYFLFVGQACFGRASGITPATDVGDALPDAGPPRSSPDGPLLPFNLAEVAGNLRYERYRSRTGGPVGRQWLNEAADRVYYSIRPWLSVRVRKHLQRFRIRGWQRILFPRWPVDATVDELMRTTMGALLQATGVARIPFVWFWPDGLKSCTMLTHDVEGRRGLDFCQELMDLDDRFGMKASYQLIPEGSEGAWRYASQIRERGYEVNLHDLNHDGHLYRERSLFLERARRINEHLQQQRCDGFRSGAMYREQAWYDAFGFQFDMSVPSVAHLEPQQGGCCTVMPYFIGGILELPLTTVQDYSLFFILDDYSTRLWQNQIALILEQNGLVSIITHPDYLAGDQERRVYTELLQLLAQLRHRGDTWIATPGEINRWWRQRREMSLAPAGNAWRVDGAGSERARVAYASLDGGRVVYSLG